jgi:hypothetical protein
MTLVQKLRADLYLDGIARIPPFVHVRLIGFTHTIEAGN